MENKGIMSTKEPAVYRTLQFQSEGEIIEKKSRFIATLRPVKTEEEAVDFWETVKKRHYDARHNCFACVLGAEGKYVRASDDGEPQGTAGRPMLEVLTGEGLTDVAAVVTRYFGGTLLGAGGLARAYTQAVKEGLAGAQIITMRRGFRCRIFLEYSLVGKAQYILGNLGILTESSDYGETVSLTVLMPQALEPVVQKELTEASGGKCRLEKVEECWYQQQG